MVCLNACIDIFKADQRMVFLVSPSFAVPIHLVHGFKSF
jgi:hypothetical protein